MKNEKGFSLVELLVVVIIIAIIAAIAIPNLLSSRRAANQAAAVNNLRTINSAQQTYFALAANNYGTFAQLAGQDLIDDAWTVAAPVTRSTYVFAITLDATLQGYCATAVAPAATMESYSISHQGVIYFLAGVTPPTCDATTGAISTGAVKQ